MKKFFIALAILAVVIAGLVIYEQFQPEIEHLPHDSQYYEAFTVEIADGIIAQCEAAGEYCRIVKIEGDAETIEIPETLEGRKVVAMERGAIRGKQKLSRLLLPQNMRILKDYAISGCDNLEFIRMPDAPTSLEDDCISCFNLMSLALPSGLKTLPDVSQIRLLALYIPADVQAFDNVAPRDLMSATIYTPAGSHAEKWARENGIRFKSCASAEEMPLPQRGTEGDYDYVTLEGKAYLYECRSESLVLDLPDTLGGCPLRQIMYLAINRPFCSLSVPDGVERLDRMAIVSTRSFTVYLPPSVTSFAPDAIDYEVYEMECWLYAHEGSAAQQYALNAFGVTYIPTNGDVPHLPTYLVRLLPGPGTCETVNQQLELVARAAREVDIENEQWTQNVYVDPAEDISGWNNIDLQIADGSAQTGGLTDEMRGAKFVVLQYQYTNDVRIYPLAYSFMARMPIENIASSVEEVDYILFLTNSSVITTTTFITGEGELYHKRFQIIAYNTQTGEETLLREIMHYAPTSGMSYGNYLIGENITEEEMRSEFLELFR